MKLDIDKKTIDNLRSKLEKINRKERLAIARAKKDRNEMLQKQYELTEKENSDK